MKIPKVSVIIPLYNTEEFVGEALRSIQSQTLRETEILVVDDGSTDRSAAVVEAFAAGDRRIRLLRQANAGQAAARNAALDIARGEFIYFMDSDDLLEPDALALCYEKCTSERLDFVFFDGVSFGDAAADEPWFDYHRAGAFEDRIYRGTEVLVRQMTAGRYRCSVCLNLVRRSLIEDARLRFYPGIIHEDELFTAILYLEARRVGRIDRELFRRRLRGCSTMTTAFSPRNVAGYMTVFRELRRYARGRDRQTRLLVRRLTAYMLNPVLRNAWALPCAARWRLAFDALWHYPRSIRPGALGVLLFKSPFKKLRGR